MQSCGVLAAITLPNNRLDAESDLTALSENKWICLGIGDGMKCFEMDVDEFYVCCAKDGRLVWIAAGPFSDEDEAQAVSDQKSEESGKGGSAYFTVAKRQKSITLEWTPPSSW